MVFIHTLKMVINMPLNGSMVIDSVMVDGHIRIAIKWDDIPIIKKKHENLNLLIWLVVSTPLKNISQWEGLSHILWKRKNV